MLRRIVFFGVAACFVFAIARVSHFGRLSPVVALSLVPSQMMASTSPTPSSSDEPSPPGGLGNRRGDLEKVYGGPTGLQGTMIAYHAGQYAATYVDNRATAVLVSYATGPVALATARKRTRSLMPRDAVFVGTLGDGPSRIADVYQSARLGAKVVSSSPGVPTGQFVVVYESDSSGAVKDVLLTVGQVPPPG